jgi:hypothetical protein
MQETAGEKSDQGEPAEFRGITNEICDRQSMPRRPQAEEKADGKQGNSPGTDV